MPKQSSNGGERASEKVRKALLQQIHSGELAIGQWLPPERTLAEQFGVSRVVIREAISTLSGEGVLVSRPGCRPVIARAAGTESPGAALTSIFTDDETGLQTMVDTRIFLEKALVRHAAEEARKEDLERLQRALERNRETIGRRGLFEETDAEFHHVLYTIPGNPAYPAIHRLYCAKLWNYWGKIDRGAEIDHVDYRGHEAVYNAIVARDAAGAEQAIQRHLIVAWELIQGIFMFHSHKM